MADTIMDTYFVRDSVLEILIPQASNRDIEEILEAAEDTDVTALVSSIPQREVLFFDESLPVYAVLRTTHNDENSLKDCLKRVSIGIEAHAVSSPNINDQTKDRTPSSSQARDVVWTGKVDVNEDPITMVVGSAEDSQTILLVWKVTASLGRPRVRLQAPSILFKVSASLQPALREKVQDADPYLPSGVPLSTNILQPLGENAASKIVLPQFSALRRNRNVSNKDDAVVLDVLPLKVVPRRACRVIPALSSRIRVQKSPFNIGASSMIGALEIDIPPSAQYAMQIAGATITLPQGIVKDISGGTIPKFPMTVRARDQLVCLYSLCQDAQATAQGVGVQTLEVLISVSVLVSVECHPQVRVRFKANVDFLGAAGLGTQLQNPSTQRSVKPIHPSEPSVKPDDQLTDASSDNQISTSKEKMGIVIKFTAKGPVYVGEPFRWEVFVINRSKKQRRIGLSMLHKRRVSSRPTSIQAGPQQEKESLAKAFTDDGLLHNMIKSHSQDTTHILCLNTDVKIGPLSPGSCFSTQMEFLPLAKGFLHIDAIRMTDYSTNEAVDMRDLPDVYAMDRQLPG